MKPIKYINLGQLFCGIEFPTQERDFLNKHIFKQKLYLYGISTFIDYTYNTTENGFKNVNGLMMKIILAAFIFNIFHTM